MDFKDSAFASCFAFESKDEQRLFLEHEGVVVFQTDTWDVGATPGRCKELHCQVFWSLAHHREIPNDEVDACASSMTLI